MVTSILFVALRVYEEIVLSCDKACRREQHSRHKAYPLPPAHTSCHDQWCSLTALAVRWVFLTINPYRFCWLTKIQITVCCYYSYVKDIFYEFYNSRGLTCCIWTDIRYDKPIIAVETVVKMMDGIGCYCKLKNN